MKRMLSKSVVLIIIVAAFGLTQAVSAPQLVPILDLGTLPGGNSSDATGINDRGQVVGVSQTASGEYHAFLWQEGTMTDLGTLPGAALPESAAYGINARGQVVGDGYFASSTLHAFLWQEGTMTDLGTLPPPAFRFSSARGINDRGQVVGGGYTASGFHAFLWEIPSAAEP
jgi:probable HAF family extracellular repeat protein